MKNLKSISIIEQAINQNWTGIFLANKYLINGYAKDQIVEILSGFLPQANNGLNDEAVKLICNAIKATTTSSWKEVEAVYRVA